MEWIKGVRTLPFIFVKPIALWQIGFYFEFCMSDLIPATTAILSTTATTSTIISASTSIAWLRRTTATTATRSSIRHRATRIRIDIARVKRSNASRNNEIHISRTSAVVSVARVLTTVARTRIIRNVRVTTIITTHIYSPELTFIGISLIF